MYLMTYIKHDGKQIDLVCNSVSELRSMINSLSDMISTNKIISFNVEVL